MPIPVVLTFLCICSMTLRKGILMIHVNHEKGLRVSNSTEVCLLQQSNVWLSIIPGPWPPLTWPVCSPGSRFAENISTPLLLYTMGIFLSFCTQRLFSWPNCNCFTLNYNPTQLSLHLSDTPPPHRPDPAHSVLRRTLVWSTSGSHLGKIYGIGVEVYAIKIYLQNI